MEEEYKPICGECGSSNIETSMEKYNFPYGFLQLSCVIPIRKCKDCGFNFMDYVGEDLVEECIKQHTSSAKKDNL